MSLVSRGQILEHRAGGGGLFCLCPLRGMIAECKRSLMKTIYRDNEGNYTQQVVNNRALGEWIISNLLRFLLFGYDLVISSHIVLMILCKYWNKKSPVSINAIVFFIYVRSPTYCIYDLMKYITTRGNVNRFCHLFIYSSIYLFAFISNDDLYTQDLYFVLIEAMCKLYHNI